MKNKKSVVSTIIAVLLAAGIISFSSTYFNTQSEIQRTTVDSFTSEQLRYFEDDIAQNIYPELINLTIRPVKSEGSAVKLQFGQYLDDNDGDNEALFSDYKNYIESNYSTNNYNFSLSGFDSSFNILPYNATYDMDNGRIYIYTKGISNLINITVIVTVDETLSGMPPSMPDDDGLDANFVPIFIYYYRQGGALIGSLTSMEQNPFESNAPFQLAFKNPPVEGVTEINVEYGEYNSNNGVLQVWLDAASGYDITGVADITLYYRRAEPIKMKLGTLTQEGKITMKSKIGNINKTTDIILYKE